MTAAAVQEDVDAVGLSIMSGAHNTLFPAVLEALKARGVQINPATKISDAGAIVIAVKPQVAFFEALGADGLRALEDVCAYGRSAFNDTFGRLHVQL